jgi:hypothetical protein
MRVIPLSFTFVVFADFHFSILHELWKAASSSY